MSKMHTFEAVQAIETVDLMKTLPNLGDRNATLRRKILNSLSLRAVRFKAVLIDGELSLRICRRSDLPRLKTRFDLWDQKQALLSIRPRRCRPSRM